MREVMDCEGMSSNIPRFPKHTIKSAKFNPFFKSTKPTFSTFSYPNQRILDTLGQCWQHNAALTSPSPPDHLMTSHDGCLCISWQCNTLAPSRHWLKLSVPSPGQPQPRPGRHSRQPGTRIQQPGHHSGHIRDNTHQHCITKFDAADFSERNLFFAGLPMYIRFVSHREYFPMSYETSCTQPDRRPGPGRQRAWWPGLASLKLPGWHRLDTGHMERRDCHQPTLNISIFSFLIKKEK